MQWFLDRIPYFIICALVSFLIVGMYSCYAMPPQLVVDRVRTLQRIQHQDCMSYDSKGNCTFWHYYDTIEPLYLLINDYAEECQVMRSTYIESHKGMQKKCYQLFGWNQVATGEFPVLERGWK